MPVELSPSGQTPISAKPKNSTMGLGCMTAFCLLFALIGAGLIYFLSIRPFQNVIQARSWTSVPCRITSSNVTSHRDSDGSTYTANIGYTYSFQGHDYSNDRYSFAGKLSSSSDSKAQARANAFPVGTTTQCFVNPAMPSEAVLNRDFNLDMGFGAFGLIFLAFGLGLPFALWRQARRQSVLTTGNRKEFWQPQPGAVLTVTAGGGVQLKPSSGSPVSRMIGAWMVCLFWNGIIGAVGWGMFHERSSGFFKIFPFLFLTPFVLIGALIFWGALHQSLAVFNPLPFLTFPTERLRPGDSIEISWELKGAGKRPNSIHIALEGVEEVKFTRGTDTITQKQVFFSSPLYDSPAGIAPASGSCRLEIPLDAMHSLEAPHNTIRWTISFKAPQTLWPDISEEWKLLVDPRPAA